MKENTKIGFIGLGEQGGPMPEMLANDGWDVYLWARREASLKPYVNIASFVESPRALGETCDQVGICVGNDDDVREVMLGESGVLAGMSAGDIIFIHSTVNPNTVKQLCDVASRKQVELLDAPVSGMRQAVYDRHLSIMAGGSADTFERVKPILECYGNPVRLMGDVGSGQQMKLLNNALSFAQIGTGFEIVRIGTRLGLDPEAIVGMLSASTSGSPALKAAFYTLANPDKVPKSSMDIVNKDLKNFQAMIQAQGIDTKLVDAAAEAGRDALQAGLS